VVQVGLLAQLLRGEGLVPVEVVAVLCNGRNGCNGRGRNGFLYTYELSDPVGGHCGLGVLYLVPRVITVLWYMEVYYVIMVYIWRFVMVPGFARVLRPV
jgi:hypothetical protein